MSLHDAKQLEKLLTSDPSFKAHFDVLARDAVAGALKDAAAQYGLSLSLDEAFVCASSWTGLDDMGWLGEARSDDMHSELVAGPCAPSTPGEGEEADEEEKDKDVKGPSEPPSAPGSKEPSSPAPSSTPGDQRR